MIVVAAPFEAHVREVGISRFPAVRGTPPRPLGGSRLIVDPVDEPELHPVLADLLRVDPLLERMVDADAEDGCWHWMGGTVRSKRCTARYGKLMRRRTPQVYWLAHRWVYVLLVGAIAPDHEIHHTCRNTLCVQPEHLEAMDPEEHAAHQDWLRRELMSYA